MTDVQLPEHLTPRIAKGRHRERCGVPLLSRQHSKAPGTPWAAGTNELQWLAAGVQVY